MNNMKLSDAIRLGALLKPQGFGDFDGSKLQLVRVPTFPWVKVENVQTSCALGAANEAVGAGFVDVIYHEGDVVEGFRGQKRVLKKDETRQVWQRPPDWAVVLHSSASCPDCGCTEDVFRMIPHLNDRHRWSRERIADFVQTIEPSTTTAAEQELSAEVPSEATSN